MPLAVGEALLLRGSVRLGVAVLLLLELRLEGDQSGTLILEQNLDLLDVLQLENRLPSESHQSIEQIVIVLLLLRKYQVRYCLYCCFGEEFIAF